MPKIFEYLGIVILFYSNEHESIHVHGKYQGKESKIQFCIEEGKVIKLEIREVKGREPLPASTLKAFRDFTEVYSQQIVQKWIDYFVLHKHVKCEKITRRVK